MADRALNTSSSPLLLLSSAFIPTLSFYSILQAQNFFYFARTSDIMMRSYLLVGILTALSQSAHGLVFKDGIKSNVDGKLLPLLHDVEDPTTVRFGESSDSNLQVWKFDTEGHNDDEAVITPSNFLKTLVCEKGSYCSLDLDGARQVYRVVRVNQTTPTFTIQDRDTSLYVSRTPDLHLELTETKSESINFLLDKNVGKMLHILLSQTMF
jgi:hypothetical protein